MDKIPNNKFATTISVIVAAVFIANLVLSRGFNLLMISLTGGGRLVDFLAASRSEPLGTGLRAHFKTRKVKNKEEVLAPYDKKYSF